MIRLIFTLCFLFALNQRVSSLRSEPLCEGEYCKDYLAEVEEVYCSPEKKFVLGLSEVSWFRALELCELEGYKLASITSEKEQEDITKYIKDLGLQDDWFWLSGTDLAKEGEFVWMTDLATPFDQYTNWYPDGEPNNKEDQEDCVHLNPRGTWNDRNCKDNLYFVCEYNTVL